MGKVNVQSGSLFHVKNFPDFWDLYKFLSLLPFSMSYGNPACLVVGAYGSKFDMDMKVERSKGGEDQT